MADEKLHDLYLADNELERVRRRTMSKAKTSTAALSFFSFVMMVD